jgi:hypothetical protein
MTNTDEQLIRKFVATLNGRGLEARFDNEVPQDLRTRELPDISEMFEWEIRASNDNPWVSTLEQLLPYPFPSPFRLLISGFRFAEFEVGPVMFFANTGELIFHDISRAIFADKGLYPTLLEAGFVQFGKQAGGGYDPICFAMKRGHDHDAPIVQLDHEDILIKHRVRVTSEVAPSFRSLVEQVIAGEFPAR